MRPSCHSRYIGFAFGLPAGATMRFSAQGIFVWNCWTESVDMNWLEKHPRPIYILRLWQNVFHSAVCQQQYLLHVVGRRCTVSWSFAVFDFKSSFSHFSHFPTRRRNISLNGLSKIEPPRITEHFLIVPNWSWSFCRILILVISCLGILASLCSEEFRRIKSGQNEVRPIGKFRMIWNPWPNLGVFLERVLFWMSLFLDSCDIVIN